MQFGPVQLYEVGEKLFAKHKALAKPVEIERKQIERYLMRQLREQLT